MLRTVGKGVAVLGADQDYQRKRRKSFLRPATSMREGFARAGRRLVLVIQQHFISATSFIAVRLFSFSVYRLRERFVPCCLRP